MMMVLWLLLGLASATPEVTLHRRFEYKHSFKGPTLIDGSGKVPFWETGGSCMPSKDSVRVTPSVRSKQGWIWNKIQYVGTNWELSLSLKITGRGKLGADGLAVWYIQEPPTSQGGSVFGSPNNWRGLGIFFDSFDNDDKHDNPVVLAMVNDGTVTYDHGNDGKGQALGHCVQGFRNRPHPAQVRVRYYDNTLTLEINPGITAQDSDFVPCFRINDVKLAPGGYFGVSAATGALADDHDIEKFLVYSLFDKVEQAVPLSEETKAKILSDYEKYDKALEEKKKQYREKHPKLEVQEEDEDNIFYKSLIDYQIMLGKKFDALSLKMNSISEKINMPSSTDAAIKSTITNIEERQDLVIRDVQSTRSLIQALLKEVQALQTKSTQSEKDLKTITLALSSTQSQLKELQSRKPCPPPQKPKTRGISFIQLLCVIIIQSTVLLGYWVWRHRAEEARKKFF